MAGLWWLLVVVTFVQFSIRIQCFYYYIGSSDGVFFLQLEVLFFFSFSVSNNFSELCELLFFLS